MNKNKKEEQIFVDFFIQHLNQRYNLDYSADLNEEESSKDGDTDAYAISGSLEKLYLQIVSGKIKYREKVYPWIQRKQKGEERTPSQLSFSGNRIDDIFLSIERKENKNYSNFENLILLITEKSSAPLLSNEHAEKLSKRYLARESSQFRGVYCLLNSPKDNSNAFCQDVHPDRIQVIAIKDIFENHGVIF